MPDATAKIIAAIEAMDEPLLLLEPRSRFDQCIVGVGSRFGGSDGIQTFVVYDRECVIQTKAEDILSDPDWDDEDGERDAHLEALEDFEFNTIGGYVGEHTPAYITIDPDTL